MSIHPASTLNINMSVSAVEGIVPFHVPTLSKPCETWYKVVGDLNGGQIPLIALHGGPGACHEYLLGLADMDVPVIFYDQIGNGRSTHLQEKRGDEEFWTTDLFVDELNNLLKHLGLDSRPVDVYGQSWGGMLAMEWAVSGKASNLRKLVLANTLASSEAYNEDAAEWMKAFPQDIQDVVAKGQETHEFDTPEYQAAVQVFYEKHMSVKRPFPPPELAPGLKWMAEDDTTHTTMFGGRGVYSTGTLRSWNITSKLDQIKVPTLLINAALDVAQERSMRPLFENIAKSKWITFDGSAHMVLIDQKEKHDREVKAFLL